MAYRAASIANEFLDLASQKGRKLTQIEIQKLVYFAHGWNLEYTEKPLIGELFEPWKYGPVVRTLYDAFRRFGSEPITAKATSWQTNDAGAIIEVTPSIQSTKSDEDENAISLVREVWKTYGALAPFKLVEVTHVENGPWAAAFTAKQIYIPNESICTYFKQLIPDSPRLHA